MTRRPSPRSGPHPEAAPPGTRRRAGRGRLQVLDDRDDAGAGARRRGAQHRDADHGGDVSTRGAVLEVRHVGCPRARRPARPRLDRGELAAHPGPVVCANATWPGGGTDDRHRSWSSVQFRATVRLCRAPPGRGSRGHRRRAGPVPMTRPVAPSPTASVSPARWSPAGRRRHPVDLADQMQSSPAPRPTR